MIGLVKNLARMQIERNIILGKSFDKIKQLFNIVYIRMGKFACLDFGSDGSCTWTKLIADVK